MGGIDSAELIQAGVLALFSAGMVVAVLAGLLSRGAWLITALVMVLCVIANPSDYGTRTPSPFALVYVLGTYSTQVTLFQIGLFLLWAAALWAAAARAPASVAPPETWRPVFGAYLALLCVFVGQLLADSTPVFSDKWWLSFQEPSWDLVLWQGATVYACYVFLNRRQDLRRLGVWMVGVLATVHVWGLVRYVFLGGDPNNAYAFLEKLAIKISFWDINHSIMAAFLMGYAAWRVLADPPKKGWMRWFFVFLAGVAMLSIVLSARRTAQGGLAVALLAILVCLPKGKRGIVALVLALSIPAALVVTAQRSKDSGSIVDKVLLDIKSERMKDPRATRFYELQRAWQSVRRSPWFGLGPQGAFRVIDNRGLEYHRNNYGFVHSGPGHLLLKVGVVGVVLYGVVLLGFVRGMTRAWPAIPRSLKPLTLGGIAALAAAFPNFLVGTPIIEVRTMYLMGALMGVLMACARFARPPSSQQTDDDGFEPTQLAI
jgi:O-antigen ligase